MELKIDNVSKIYKGKRTALDRFSLEVGKGILGLLGPNGAGKSTLMRILATITKPTTGVVLWNGKDIVSNCGSIRKVVGYLPQDFGVYPNLNAVEFLNYLAALKEMDPSASKKRIEELLFMVNLHEVRKQPLGSYSGGMKQRVGIAQALLNDPKLLIVDEPTVGLDPEERIRFRNLLSELAENRIVILSTHIVSDVEATANDIAIINKGNLIAHASPEALLDAACSKVWEWTAVDTELSGIRDKFIISSAVQTHEGSRVRVISDVIPHAAARQVTPTLEDAYLYCINNGRKDEAAWAQ